MRNNRREFIRDGAIAGAAMLAAFRGREVAAAPPAWPVGCFNRPWAKWPFAQTLASVKAAGYGITGLLTRTSLDPFIAADAPPDYLETLKRLIDSSGVAVNMAALGSRHDVPLDEAIKGLQLQIDRAAYLGVKYAMTFGIDQPDQYEHYFKAMAATAAYAQEKRIQLVMKPHGGSSGASGEILAAIKKVDHPNFKIWYDAGNIIYYTGKDPVAELEPIVQHVTGFCAKDCAEMKGDVMIQFGAGKVEFGRVFRALKAGGFSGPIMVECCAPGDTPDAIAANAAANRAYLAAAMRAL